MQNQTFDQRMRQKAQGERWGASAQAQGRLEKAMRKGVQQQKPAAASNGWPRAIAWAAAAAAVVLMIIMIHPPADLTDGSAVLSAVGLGPTPVPVTVPQGTVDFTVENRMLKAQATFSNHTGDIWLIAWSADPSGDVRSVLEPTELIWLETGITFRDHADWRLNGQWTEKAEETKWHFEGYRVAAEVLHWIEGEWLLPGSEGYEEQQMLIEDAFVNGALILAPGDWPEGTSGEMQLVLPDGYQQEHPEMDALTYYMQNGLLELAVAESHPAPER